MNDFYSFKAFRTSMSGGFGRLQRLMLVFILVTAVYPGTLRAENTGDLKDTKMTALEGITVTANKMEEDVHDVPQSITVIDEYILEEKGIRNIADVINEIPNMSITPEGGHGSPVNFRGLNTSAFTNNNPVVIYIDGVPYSLSFACLDFGFISFGCNYPVFHFSQF